MTQQRRESGKLGIVAHRQHEIAVGAGKGFIGHDIGVRIAEARRILAGHQGIERLVGQRRQLHIQQCHIDMTPLAGLCSLMQRRQHANGGIQAGHHVGDRHPGLHRHAIWLSGQAHQPAQRLHHEVIARPMRPGTILTKAGDRTHYQRRILGAQRLGIQPIACQPANLEILEHDVGPGGQAPDQLLPFGRGDIHAQRLLAAVGTQVVGRQAIRVAHLSGIIEPRRPPATGIIAALGMLDLDHAGAEIRQQLAGPGPGQYA